MLKRFVLSVLFLTAAARAFTLLPNQTFYADPALNLFPAGTFKEGDKLDPKFWTDMAAVDAGNVMFSREFLVLDNKDAAKSVHVEAILPLPADAHWIAASAVVIARNVVLPAPAADALPADPAAQTDSSASVSLSFLDKDKKLIAPAGDLSPLLKGKYVGQKVRLVSAQVPEGAAFLSIKPQLDHATGQLGVARITITAPDPANAPDPAKVVALHRYIKAGNLKGVQTLLAADKKLLESRNNDYDGGTPLMGAAWEGKADIAQALLDAGANPQALDLNYQTNATTWAAYWGHPQVLELLYAKTGGDRAGLLQEVKIGRGRNHKNTPDEDFQACEDFLNGKAAASAPTSMP